MTPKIHQQNRDQISLWTLRINIRTGSNCSLPQKQVLLVCLLYSVHNPLGYWKYIDVFLKEKQGPGMQHRPFWKELSFCFNLLSAGIIMCHHFWSNFITLKIFFIHIFNCVEFICFKYVFFSPQKSQGTLVQPARLVLVIWLYSHSEAAPAADLLCSQQLRHGNNLSILQLNNR